MACKYLKQFCNTSILGCGAAVSIESLMIYFKPVYATCPKQRNPYMITPHCWRFK